MTKPQPLNASPLWLHSHRFTEISLQASDQEDPQGGFSLSTQRTLQTHSDNPLKFLLTLQVSLGSNSKNQEAPYSANITIEGEFEVAEKFTASSPEELVQVTGASMLYGACREMLANLTARSSHGMSTLPSVSFGFAKSNTKKAAKKATKKSAKKKTATKATKKKA